MTTKPKLHMAVSTIMLGTLLVSCATGPGGRPAELSAEAQKALRKGDAEKALVRAESAVLADPRNADLRRVLADAYIANGRFLAAEQSYDDAYQLGDSSARTVISLAMMHVAQGDNRAAQALLNDNRDVLPVADYGLAIALAGQTKTGVEVLADEIRGGVNTPKVRQNLALAYALDGRWREAQIMVAQDVDPAGTKARITEWARLAHPDAYAQRVASVLGVTPVADTGQPVQLALANNPPVVALVDQIAADATDDAVTEPVAEAPAPVAVATAAPIEPVAVPQSTTPQFSSRPKVQPLPANYQPGGTRPVQVASAAPRDAAEATAFARAVTPEPAKAKPQAPARVFKPVAGGAYAVQLGVFSTPGNADRAWSLYSGRHSDLAAFAEQRIPTEVGGRTLHRLVANGFADEASARAMCAKVRGAGGECIIALAETAKPAPKRVAAKPAAAKPGAAGRTTAKR